MQTGVCFEATVHSLKESKPHAGSGTYLLQIRLEDQNHEGETAEFTFDAPLKGPLPPMKMEGDDCGPNARLKFLFFKVSKEKKQANALLGVCTVEVARGMFLDRSEEELSKTDDQIVLNVSIADVTTREAYIKGLPPPNAPSSSSKSGGDSAAIPMLYIDDVFDSKEAVTDAGESVSVFVKQLEEKFEVTNGSVEEIAITALRICDFPVHPDPAKIPELPSDLDIMHVLGIHPSDFKKLREGFPRASGALRMQAYHDVLQRKDDLGNVLDPKQFDWADDNIGPDGIPIAGTVSQWNKLVQVSSVALFEGNGREACVTSSSRVSVCERVYVFL
jgi:hypothetical protein